MQTKTADIPTEILRKAEHSLSKAFILQARKAAGCPPQRALTGYYTQSCVWGLEDRVLLLHWVLVLHRVLDLHPGWANSTGFIQSSQLNPSNAPGQLWRCLGGEWGSDVQLGIRELCSPAHGLYGRTWWLHQVMLLTLTEWRTKALLRNTQQISKGFSLLLGTLCHSVTALLSSDGENRKQWVAKEAEWSPWELHSCYHLQNWGRKAERCRWLALGDLLFKVPEVANRLFPVRCRLTVWHEFGDIPDNVHTTAGTCRLSGSWAGTRLIGSLTWPGKSVLLYIKGGIERSWLSSPALAAFARSQISSTHFLLSAP